MNVSYEETAKKDSTVGGECLSYSYFTFASFSSTCRQLSLFDATGRTVQHTLLLQQQTTRDREGDASQPAVLWTFSSHYHTIKI